jgi:hypothetical protein
MALSQPTVLGAPSTDYRISKISVDRSIDIRHQLYRDEAIKPEVYKSSPNRPLLRILASELGKLMTTLELSLVTSSECLVSPGRWLSIPANEMPAVHYNIMGASISVAGNAPPITLAPQTLVILPPRQSFSIEGPIDEGRRQSRSAAGKRRDTPEAPGTARTNVRDSRRRKSSLTRQALGSQAAQSTVA